MRFVCKGLNSTQLRTEKNCSQYISLHALYCIWSPSINPIERKKVNGNWRRILRYRRTSISQGIFTLTLLRCKIFYDKFFRKQQIFLNSSTLRTFYVVSVRNVQSCTIVMWNTAKTKLSCHLKVLLAEHFEKHESEFASYCINIKQNYAFCWNTNHYKSLLTICTFALLFILQTELCFF
jgi:hypothetical protein